MKDEIFSPLQSRFGCFPKLLAVLGVALIIMGLVLNLLLNQGRSQQLADRLDALELQDKRQPSLIDVERLKTSVSELSSTMSQQAGQIAALESSLTTERKENSTLHHQLSQAQKAIREQLGLLDARVSALQVPRQQTPAPVTPVAPAAKVVPPVAKKVAGTSRLPFVLTGIETRGNQLFAAVAPPAFHSLSQIVLLTPGDSSAGWTLTALDQTGAAFERQGVKRRLQAAGGGL